MSSSKNKMISQVTSPISHREYFDVFTTVFEKAVASARLESDGKIEIDRLDEITMQTVGSDDRWMDYSEYHQGAPYEMLTGQLEGGLHINNRLRANPQRWESKKIPANGNYILKF